MPVPKRKKSRTRSRQGRTHYNVKGPTLVACPKCREMIPPHQVCKHCGNYKGQEVVRLETK